MAALTAINTPRAGVRTRSRPGAGLEAPLRTAQAPRTRPGGPNLARTACGAHAAPSGRLRAAQRPLGARGPRRDRGRTAGRTGARAAAEGGARPRQRSPGPLRAGQGGGHPEAARGRAGDAPGPPGRPRGRPPPGARGPFRGPGAGSAAAGPDGADGRGGAPEPAGWCAGRAGGAWAAMGRLWPPKSASTAVGGRHLPGTGGGESASARGRGGARGCGARRSRRPCREGV